ncbi:hypothetical protein RC77_14130 [Pectobacterium brasiliense]|uniref:AbiJ-NTD4 domain-containing protein n=1 Tax=Pectobacterium brasiliense TaxID=180957 RepID=UPI00057C727F|nr:hypothetical protein [Pectobacterium brasiliense]KHS67357.1 hypothetical protein RC77_14130 [Pectobacterium brasiliense]
MPSFSQRMGIRPMHKVIQRESMDDELRTGLWNCLYIEIWSKYKAGNVIDTCRVENIARLIWVGFFKKAADAMPLFNYKYTNNKRNVLDYFKGIFWYGEWYETYDFIEFALKCSYQDWEKRLTKRLNEVLEEENAAYRIVDGKVLETTDEQEISAIETAIESNSLSVKTHLQQALELLSDRKQPDYRNSIKESISAVESACNAISGDEKGTLGKSLKQIDTSIGLHPSLKNAFSNLYGYTSDSGGIRHALTDESEHPSFADAKFMLVACCAFCNFLWTKMAEKGQ